MIALPLNWELELSVLDTQGKGGKDWDPAHVVLEAVQAGSSHHLNSPKPGAESCHPG
jgi:hypothetical protein